MRSVTVIGVAPRRASWTLVDLIGANFGEKYSTIQSDTMSNPEMNVRFQIKLTSDNSDLVVLFLY